MFSKITWDTQVYLVITRVFFFPGEVSILFSLSFNAFKTEFLKNGNVAVELQELNRYLLMYAYDMVIFAASVDELQRMLNTLYVYSSRWN